LPGDEDPRRAPVDFRFLNTTYSDGPANQVLQPTRRGKVRRTFPSRGLKHSLGCHPLTLILRAQAPLPK
jgi:hypothetical protein